MPRHKKIILALGIVCIFLAIAGGLMHPLSTMSGFESFAFVTVVSLGTSGIIYLLYQFGFNGTQ